MSNFLSQNWYGFYIESIPKRVIIGPAGSKTAFRDLIAPLKKKGVVKSLSYADIYSLFNVTPPPTIKPGDSARGPLTFIREKVIVTLLPCV